MYQHINFSSHNSFMHQLCKHECISLSSFIEDTLFTSHWPELSSAIVLPWFCQTEDCKFWPKFSPTVVKVGGDDVAPCKTDDCWLRALCCCSRGLWWNLLSIRFQAGDESMTPPRRYKGRRVRRKFFLWIDWRRVRWLPSVGRDVSLAWMIPSHLLFHFHRNCWQARNAFLLNQSNRSRQGIK